MVLIGNLFVALLSLTIDAWLLLVGTNILFPNYFPFAWNTFFALLLIRVAFNHTNSKG